MQMTVIYYTSSVTLLRFGFDVVQSSLTQLEFNVHMTDKEKCNVLSRLKILKYPFRHM